MKSRKPDNDAVAKAIVQALIESGVKETEALWLVKYVKKNYPEVMSYIKACDSVPYPATPQRARTAWGQTVTVSTL